MLYTMQCIGGLNTAMNVYINRYYLIYINMY